MIGASALACSGDFLLCFAGCQHKDLVAEVRRTAFAASGFCSRRGRGARVALERPPSACAAPQLPGGGEAGAGRVRVDAENLRSRRCDLPVASTKARGTPEPVQAARSWCRSRRLEKGAGRCRTPPLPWRGGASRLDAHLGSRSECEDDQPECVGNPRLSCRGTGSSNPSPSSGESANSRSPSR